MVGKSKKHTDQAIVDIQFEEYLTSSSCSKVVVEIIKYLAYQKQQIPYPFEQLKLLVNRKKVHEAPSAENRALKQRSLQLERHYSKAAEAVDTLENIFKNIEAEFLAYGDGTCRVEEVVVLFGATPITPKDVFRIQLPLIRDHCAFETPKPPSRKMMVHLLKCLLESEGLHLIVSQPITTTNAFVFFKRKPVSDKVTKIEGGNKSWFLPRENFRLPQKGRQAVFRIECIPEVIPEIDFDSPLAHPLVDISDLEEICDMQIKVEQELLNVGNCAEGRNACIPGSQGALPCLNILSNHLVFKPVPRGNEVCAGNPSPMNEDKNLSNNVQCLVEESINNLNQSMQELQFNSCRTENSSMQVNCIEWFEARVPLRGFKDYVVNGVSAINA